jgi:phosphoglucomutase
LIAELVAYERKTLTQIWADIAAAIGPLWTDRVDLTLTQANKQRLLDTLAAAPKERFLDRAVTAYNGVDGFKFRFNDAEWVLIRPSGTEPIIRCYFESDTAAKGDLLKDALRRYVAGVVGAG